MQIERLYPPGHRAWWSQQAMRRNPQQPNNQKHIHPSVELVDFTCQRCGQVFQLSHTQAANRAPKFCSRHCSALNAARGAEAQLK